MSATAVVDPDQLVSALDEIADDYALDPESQRFVDELVARFLVFMEALAGFELYGYQRRLAARIMESVITGDAEQITALQARQSGKSETVACCVATLMILLPLLAPSYPELLGKFKKGVFIGCFAPTDELADIIFERVQNRLESDEAWEVLSDPEINEEPKFRGKIIKLKNGSFCRKNTAHPKAKIEGRTYHLIIIDESQDADDERVRKSIHPMRTAVAGTIVKIGTPTTHKGDFYTAIQVNKRRQLGRGKKQNHFEANWKEVVKFNPDYLKTIRTEAAQLGEDSDEFQMAYNLKWLLDRGMFVDDEILDPESRAFMGDKSMTIQHQWYASPCVVGIDVARETDSTVVTVVAPDWGHEDPFGHRQHRILAWLEIHGENWETQYAKIHQFLSNYWVQRIGVDSNGMGSAVAERLAIIFPHIEVVPLLSSRPEQSKRWKYLAQLLQKRYVSWPAHAETRRLRTYRRFVQQMEDLEKQYIGDYLLAAAPDESGAHDDYPDSLACAVIMTEMEATPEVEVFNNPFNAHRRR